ncbi:hypothetical protein BSKO_10624 [Bryopsis sp. KO-2023]|nr:hypothetical protein BSKO_10624 [Bryopsis sp. KO-2023]
MTLDAHRQVLNDFTESFPTYRKLLTDVKKHMDACLDAYDGVRCARDNVILREQLAKAEESAEAEVETAKLETSLDAAEIRKTLHPRLSEAAVLANKAEFRKKAAIQDLKQARRELLEEREMLNEAREMREKLSALLEAESQWHENGLAEELSSVGLKWGQSPRRCPGCLNPTPDFSRILSSRSFPHPRSKREEHFRNAKGPL